MSETPSVIIRVSPELLRQVEQESYWREDGVRLRAVFVPEPHPPEEWATEARAVITADFPPLRDRLRHAWRTLMVRNRVVVR